MYVICTNKPIYVCVSMYVCKYVHYKIKCTNSLTKKPHKVSLTWSNVTWIWMTQDNMTNWTEKSPGSLNPIQRTTGKWEKLGAGEVTFSRRVYTNTPIGYLGIYPFFRLQTCWPIIIHGSFMSFFFCFWSSTFTTTKFYVVISACCNLAIDEFLY